MQGGTAPWGKDTVRKSPEGGALNEEVLSPKWPPLKFSLNFSESEAHCHAVAVLPSPTTEPPPVLCGIHLQKPLFG